MKLKHRSASPLKNKARRGFRGYPIATIIFYGPDDKRASKAVASIINADGEDPAELKRWFSDDHDVRTDRTIGNEIIQFIRGHEAKSVVMMDQIFGCPHEEGIDYPEGQVCPQCPFWAHRDRYTGEYLQ